MRAITQWLIGIVVLVGVMVAVGGITRLTGSGLSITEWAPILGVIPPLNEADWQVAFSRYQEIPQYRLVNSTMTLAQFKWIFFWEYLHRLAARLVGVVFLVPFLVFLIRKQVPRRFVWPLWGLFGLGGLQGFLGWFMVRSGLSDLTSVSHFRLSVHLITAFFIGAATIWILKSLLDEMNPARVAARQDLGVYRRAPVIFGILLLIQTLYGAFTAGLKAGYQFQSFPTFYGEWLPAQMWERVGFFSNILSNPVMVQWIHRVLGTVLVVGALGFWFHLRGRLTCRSQRVALTAFAHLLTLQYIIGASVVLNGVPVWLGTFHQVTGYLLFVLATHFWYEFRAQRVRVNA